MMKVIAYGKINLNLYVCGRRGGYHFIDSVMHTVDCGDVLDVRESDEIKISYIGADIGEEVDSARKAAKAVYGLTGVAFSATVEKHIPVGGGMGGSSADGAGLIFAALKLLEKKGVTFDVAKAAAMTGSDVLFMIKGGAARVRGTGDVIAPLPPACFDALVIDCGEVSTAACYSAFDKLGVTCGGNADRVAELLAKGLPLPDEELQNDLLAPAGLLNPRVEEARKILSDSGISSHLTGSGGCLFVINGADAAIRALEGRFNCFRVKSKAFGVEVIG